MPRSEACAHGEADGRPTPATELAVVTVTFSPDLQILQQQVAQLPEACRKVWVDNASPDDVAQALQALADARGDVLLVRNSSNLGLATALNLGVRAARLHWPACTHVLLLDQDTEPGIGGAEALLAAHRRLSATDARLGCVGPAMIDAGTGLEHGFHQLTACRWVRRYGVADEAIEVANLNGSGTLMRGDLFEELGGLDEGFFIDHVDTEWSFRVQSAGYALMGVPGVSFVHRMGERSIRFWLFGWRIWPYRSPSRHYFLFRNTLRLMRRATVPVCWKLWAAAKLAATFAAHLAVDDARREQARNMLRGLRDGVAGTGDG